MSSQYKNSNGWESVYSEQGQLQGSHCIYESQIVFKMDNPNYSQQSQYQIIQSTNQKESQQSETNLYDMISKSYNFIFSYEQLASQIKQAQIQQLAQISQNQKQVSSRQNFINSDINISRLQSQNNNNFKNLYQNRQSYDYSTTDQSQLKFQTNQFEQSNKDPTYLKYFQNLSQALSGNANQNDLVFFSSCIKEIQLLCEKKPKIKICQLQKQINQMNTPQIDKIEKQISDEEKEETKVDKELQQHDQNQEIKLQNDQLIEKQKSEELKKQQEIQNSLCGLCLDPINSYSHQVIAPKYFTDTYQYFQAKCGHYISKICLATTYQGIFQDSIPKTVKQYDEQLEKKSKLDLQLNCNHCNYKLQMDEVLEQNNGYLTHVRSNRKQFECGICIVDYDLEEEGIAMFDCDHIFCIQCLTSYIIQCINQNKFRYEDFKCPQDKCTAIINNYTVDRLMNTPENQMLFNRMIRMQLVHTTFKKEKIALCPGFQMRNKQTNNILNVDQETITLLRLGMPPQLSDDVEIIGCTTFFSYDENKVQFYECSNCKYKSCLKGCEDAHIKGSKRGKNCSEFKKWKQQNQGMDIDLLAIFDKDTMCQCPKCKAIIIRNGGCNHMTCTMPNCGFQFCFKCQSKWLCWKHLHYF
ncbi:Ibr domain protein (macronuclear) [Tetrahymena thermophila SB210]|uniref:RBR-type E3 ubiquitin transferase n=1 Tax=Tetrahymena thermophila (strain SB210) TaxID=312017 RepID=I7MEG5_TETTS|nr:Ibr domain protein [Tetrahymena thermophila SB210]EAR96313.2 Ibr domain protein [Tetrahymena thermophila SB210]|eukprot:XP_001016558.2 Ibr domain protein [Tetrahymena thermophila SB210]